MVKNKRRNFWMILDLSVCIAFGLLNGILVLTSYIVIYLTLMVFCGFVLIWILGGRPYLPQLPRTKKCAYTILRCILYSGALVFSLLPYSMNYDAVWYYPVQRAMVLSCYTSEARQILDNEIPRHIPSDAENFQFRYSPKIGQGNSVLEISFFADSETIAEYRDFAEEHCTKRLSLTLPEGMTEENFDLDGDPSHLSSDEFTLSKWRELLREDYGQDPDGMELYLFGSLLYVLSEENGYFLLYN
ncbi:MAG: hypothetical protein E7502_03730 [Ruminococcus sp.]|nr:hypothetical protein [Ruminococcus sp.]